MLSKDIAWLYISCNFYWALWLDVETTPSKVSSLPTHTSVCGTMLPYYLYYPWRKNSRYCICKEKQNIKIESRYIFLGRPGKQCEGKMCRGARSQAMLLRLFSQHQWHRRLCSACIKQTDCLTCLVLTLHWLGFLFHIMKDTEILLKVLIPWGAECVRSRKLFGGRTVTVCLLHSVSDERCV